MDYYVVLGIISSILPLGVHISKLNVHWDYESFFQVENVIFLKQNIPDQISSIAFYLLLLSRVGS